MMEENNAVNKKTGASGKIGTVITLILCIIMIPILVFNSTLIVKSVINKNEVPDFFGTRCFIVLTGSMEDTIMSGDLIVTKSVDTDDLKDGDIISFYDPAGNGMTVITHRIISVTEQNGEKAFQTKGDANNIEDRDLVPASKVLGIYQFKLGGVGNACMFMQTTPGLVVCVVIPLILFVLYDAIRRRKYDQKKKDDTEELMAELERLKAEKSEREAAKPAESAAAANAATEAVNAAAKEISEKAEASASSDETK